MSDPGKDAKAPAATACAWCAAGPTGIEGHDHLRVKALGNLAVRFECRDCRRLWSRSDVTGGGFAWASVDGDAPVDRKHSAGVPVPNR